MINPPGSKDSEATCVSWNCPLSDTSIPEIPVVSVSVPQENLPLVVSQRSLLVVAVSQSVRPEPLTPPSKEDEPSTSNRPDINRSLTPVRKEEVVVLVPNLE